MADKQLMAALHEAAKIAQIRADLHLDDDREAYTLKGHNPTMKMEIEPAGQSAQMQVIDLTSGHPVASMEYFKTTKEFIFSLSDPGSGVIKAQFEIKQDGKAYIGSHAIATEAFVEDTAGLGGLFQFQYRVAIAAANTAAAKHIAFKQVGTTPNEIYKTTTTLYVHKKDKGANDMSLFLDAIDDGDYFNIHDNNNINQFVSFDVTGKPVKTGDVYAIPVSWYAENGAFNNDEIVNIHWKQHGAGTVGPAGPKGDKGDTGPAGAKGDKGDTGTAGAAGAKGAKGDPGVAGPTGPTGPAGAKGAKGDPGTPAPADAVTSTTDTVKKETRINKMVSMAQADYDALATKEADKLYIIV